MTDWSDLRVVGGGPGRDAGLIVSGVGGRDRRAHRDKGQRCTQEEHRRNPVLGFMRAHTLIHPDIFVRWRAFWIERTPCFSRKSTQLFVHEAPGQLPDFESCSGSVAHAVNLTCG